MANKMEAVQKYGCIISVYIYFKCYSILHFAVCQLLFWAFLLFFRTIAIVIGLLGDRLTYTSLRLKL